jgi:RNA polymerase sigma factor for flagellar operon FliA
MGADRDRLVKEHLYLVQGIAGKLKRSLSRTLDQDDLVAYGSKGLVEAAERFDPSHGVAFATFAYYRIRGAMVDGMRAMGWYSRADYARYRAEERATEYMRSVAEREAAGASAPQPKATDPGQTLEEIADILANVTTVHITSLEAAASVADERLPAPDEDLAHLQTMASARRALGKLPDKERRLIELYYFEDRTLEDAGAQLGGLSKSWVCRLHARAVKLLREAMEEEGATAEVCNR